MNKVYKSLDEVDGDLKILKLKADIEEEKIKLNFNQIKEELHPKNLLTDLFGQVTRATLFGNLINRLSPKKKRK